MRGRGWTWQNTFISAKKETVHSSSSMEGEEREGNNSFFRALECGRRESAGI